MIAGAEAELGRRVHDLLARERLLDDGATVKTYSTPRRLAVLVEGVRAAAGRHRGEADGAVVEDCVQGWRCRRRLRRLLRRRRALRLSAGEGDDAEGRVCGRDGEDAQAKRRGDSDGRAAEGSAGDLLGEEYVLARGQAGAVCAAGAVGGGPAGCCGCAGGVCWDRGWRMRAAGIGSCTGLRQSLSGLRRSYAEALRGQVWLWMWRSGGRRFARRWTR